jgi:hypothetical protein
MKSNQRLQSRLEGISQNNPIIRKDRRHDNYNTRLHNQDAKYKSKTQRNITYKRGI